MERYDTHVFLGPTLDIETAKHYLRQAHYHPPIQCGDILRLLRLTPKRIILIDGLYEQVPAVWHKEIMLALDRGVEVYGAASMGALRAAELHAFGMIGVGKIFQAYASHALVDDDEVAVLHYGQEQGSLPINDAMVNIRATLERAHREGVIGLDVKQSLTAWCKKQFYPSRSLRQALKQMNVAFPEECSRLNAWLNQYGLVDVKRHDAIEVLQHVQTAILSKGNIPTVDNKMPVLPFTKFIASLVDDVDGTPFHTLQDWLPDIEKKIKVLSDTKAQDYKLVFELAKLIKYSFAVIELDDLLDEEHHYLHYIQANDLYFPEKFYQYLHHHAVLSPLSRWMLHYICLGNITNQRIKAYLPIVAFYFEYDVLSDFSAGQELLSWILMFVFLMQQQLNDQRLKVKREVLLEHLEDIKFWQRYAQHKKRSAEEKHAPAPINLKLALSFVMTYMKIIYIHHGFKDIKLGEACAPDYFKWIYDAMALYESDSLIDAF